MGEKDLESSYFNNPDGNISFIRYRDFCRRT
jgi:hypothetical protein